MPKNTDHLYNLIKKEALTGGVFQLRGGTKSDVYIDARKVFLHPTGAGLAAQKMSVLLPHGVQFIGGVATGGIAPASQLLVVAGLPKARGFYVRTVAKPHGAKAGLEENDPRRWFEGYEPGPGDSACLVDDVITTGTSVLEASALLQKLGVNVRRVVALIDREAGAEEALAAHGVELRSVYRISQF